MPKDPKCATTAGEVMTEALDCISLVLPAVKFPTLLRNSWISSFAKHLWLLPRQITIVPLAASYLWGRGEGWHFCVGVE